MTIGGTARRRWRLRHVAAAGVVLVSGFGFASYNRHPAHVDDHREDCPHTWRGFRQPGNSGATITRIAIAEFTSDIPEFHDCQKLIATDGKSYLRQPTAIFAHQRLAAQWDNLETMPLSSGSSGGGGTAPGTPGGVNTGAGSGNGSTTNAVAIVEILNYGPDYAPLGIKTGFNCLFVARTAASPPNKYRALMVPVGTDESCTTPARFDTLLNHGKELTLRQTVPNLSPESYPPVARWDWDKANDKQFIGVMCRQAWCEVGDGNFTTSANYTGGRVRSVKGWYDEQRLAVTAADGESLVPSRIMGTVFPNSHLEAFTTTQFSGNWIEVASVALSTGSDEYQTKLNFEASPATTAGNRVYLCSGMTRADCAPKLNTPLTHLSASPRAIWRLPTCTPPEEGEAIWWAKIRSARTGAEVYRCVDRWAVPTDAANQGFKVPGTARWRWLLKDETIWQACIQGCCQVKQF